MFDDKRYVLYCGGSSELLKYLIGILNVVMLFEIDDKLALVNLLDVRYLLDNLHEFATVALHDAV